VDLHCYTACIVRHIFFPTVADRWGRRLGQLPRAPREGTPKEGRGEQKTRICVTKNMWGHSLEILPRAPENTDPPLLSNRHQSSEQVAATIETIMNISNGLEGTAILEALFCSKAT